MPLTKNLKQETEKFSQSYIHKMIDDMIIYEMVDNISNHKEDIRKYYHDYVNFIKKKGPKKAREIAEIIAFENIRYCLGSYNPFIVLDWLLILIPEVKSLIDKKLNKR